MNIQPGDFVKVINDRPSGWFRKNDYPEFLTGKVIKVFDKGTFSMRINDLKKRVQHFMIEQVIS